MIMAENTAGDPMSLLRWTHKSTGRIAEELTRLGHPASDETVRRKLLELDYSLQANRKTLDRRSPRERDAQFRYINRLVKQFLRRGHPVLSVDTKKKERVGNFKNPGRSWRPRRQPTRVNIYDYPHLGDGPAIPYGAYDVGRTQGFVNVGISHDTAEFAVESLRRWWRLIGRRPYATASAILLCADGGGSNGFRNRAWKYHLQQLADHRGVEVTVCHYPPGTSKWNKIEHRLFSYISVNWKGQPLVSYESERAQRRRGTTAGADSRRSVAVGSVRKATSQKSDVSAASSVPNEACVRTPPDARVKTQLRVGGPTLSVRT